MASVVGLGALRPHGFSGFLCEGDEVFVYSFPSYLTPNGEDLCDFSV